MEKYLVHRNNVDSSQFVFRMSLISPSSSTILGRFRCFSKSRDLLTYRLGSRRNCIVSRELDRSPHKNICTKHLILYLRPDMLAWPPQIRTFDTTTIVPSPTSGDQTIICEYHKINSEALRLPQNIFRYMRNRSMCSRRFT